MRTFIALPLPDDVAAGLVALTQPLNAGRAVPEDNLHLTLVFLGEVAPEALDDLHLELEALAWRPFPLRLAGLEAFGGARPTVLVVRGEGGPALADLQRAVARAVRRAGIETRRERFAPHVTLARFGRTVPPEEAARLGRFLQARGDAAFAPFTVGQLSLYRSDLRADGARHTVLATYPAVP